MEKTAAQIHQAESPRSGGGAGGAGAGSANGGGGSHRDEADGEDQDQDQLGAEGKEGSFQDKYQLWNSFIKKVSVVKVGKVSTNSRKRRKNHFSQLP